MHTRIMFSKYVHIGMLKQRSMTRMGHNSHNSSSRSDLSVCSTTQEQLCHTTELYRTMQLRTFVQTVVLMMVGLGSDSSPADLQQQQQQHNHQSKTAVGWIQASSTQHQQVPGTGDHTAVNSSLWGVPVPMMNSLLAGSSSKHAGLMLCWDTVVLQVAPLLPLAVASSARNAMGTSLSTRYADKAS